MNIKFYNYSIVKIRALFRGWKFYDGPDSSITGWGNLNTYERIFGQHTGRLGLARELYTEVDGLCKILPRGMDQYRGSWQDVMKVVIMLRIGDLARCKEDEVWTSGQYGYKSTMMLPYTICIRAEIPCMAPT